MNFLIKPLTYWLMKRAEEKGKVFNITGVGNDNRIYMIRYIPFKSRWFSLYIHRFLLSDRDTHHDHPWNFFTYVVEKSYTEELMEQKGLLGVLSPTIIERKTGSLAYRKAEAIHRVIVDKDRTKEEEKEAPLTICLMLKRRRMWGFVSPNCQITNGSITSSDDSLQEFEIVGHSWINHKTFLEISPSDPRYFGNE